MNSVIYYLTSCICCQPSAPNHPIKEQKNNTASPPKSEQYLTDAQTTSYSPSLTSSSLKKMKTFSSSTPDSDSQSSRLYFHKRKIKVETDSKVNPMPINMYNIPYDAQELTLTNSSTGLIEQNTVFENFLKFMQHHAPEQNLENEMWLICRKTDLKIVALSLNCLIFTNYAPEKLLKRDIVFLLSPDIQPDKNLIFQNLSDHIGSPNGRKKSVKSLTWCTFIYIGEGGNIITSNNTSHANEEREKSEESKKDMRSHSKSLSGIKKKGIPVEIFTYNIPSHDPKYLFLMIHSKKGTSPSKRILHAQGIETVINHKRKRIQKTLEAMLQQEKKHATT